MQAMARDARVDVEDVDHVVVYIGSSIVPCIATKAHTSDGSAGSDGRPRRESVVSIYAGIQQGCGHL